MAWGGSALVLHSRPKAPRWPACLKHQLTCCRLHSVRRGGRAVVRTQRIEHARHAEQVLHELRLTLRHVPGTACVRSDWPQDQRPCTSYGHAPTCLPVTQHNEGESLSSGG